LSILIKRLVIGIIVGLVVGSMLGYSVSQTNISKLEQQLSQLEKQISDLQTQLESKNTQIDNLQNTIKNKNSQISILQSQIDSKNTKISSLQSQLSERETEIVNLQSQISARDSTISELESQIEKLEKLIPPIIEGEWNLIATFVGRGDYITDYFYIPDIDGVELRINWTNLEYDSDKWIQYIKLYHKGEEWWYESLLVPEKEIGTWLIHPPLKTGYNYLEIDTWIYEDSDWKITIEVFIPE